MNYNTKSLKKQSIPSMSPSQASNADIISDLPLEIIHSILERLPLPNAARTSVLSTKWKSKWLSIPNLYFNYQNLTPPRASDQLLDWPNFAYIVDHVLMQHNGPIQKFTCNISPVFGPTDSCNIDHWLIFASRCGVKEVVLDFGDWNWESLISSPGIQRPNFHYRIPSCVMKSHDLCSLRLVKRCSFEIPSKLGGLCNLTTLELVESPISVPQSFTGFPNLKNLILQIQYYVVAGDQVTLLISKCPRLEMLELNTYEHQPLEIHAPNLRRLTLKGYFDDISFGTFPFLSEVTFGISSNNKKCGRTHVLVAFHGISYSKLSCQGSKAISIATTYHNLRNLHLEVDFNYQREITTMSCLCQSSPNLCFLRVEIKYCYHCSTVEDWRPFGKPLDTGNGINCSFNQLRFFDIFGISSIGKELEFIRYVLAEAPMLDIMKLKIHEHVESGVRIRILESLLQFPRASTRAQILPLGVKAKAY